MDVIISLQTTGLMLPSVLETHLIESKDAYRYLIPKNGAVRTACPLKPAGVAAWFSSVWSNKNIV